MQGSQHRVPIGLLIALALAACEDPSARPVDTGQDFAVDMTNAPDGATDASADRSDALQLDNRCITSTSWRPGTAAFRDATEAAGFDAIGATAERVSALDFDGDGWPDIVARLVGNQANDYAAGSRAVWLLRNRGDGTFEDVTEASGIDAARGSASTRPAETFAFADVDNDGDLDAFSGITQEGSLDHGAEIMLNRGDGTFEMADEQPFRNASMPSSVAGATFVDVDRDGLVDLFIGRNRVDGVPAGDKLYVQTAPLVFEDRTSGFGLSTRFWLQPADLDAGRGHTIAWSTGACDLDGDGNTELISSSYGRAPNHLWHGEGTAGVERFANISVASGYAYDDQTDWSDNESARCHCQLNPLDGDCGGVPAPTVPCVDQNDVKRWNHQTDRATYLLGGNTAGSYCADIDNDGDLDLVNLELVHWDVGASSDPTQILLNDGSSPPGFSRPGNQQTGLLKTHTLTEWDEGDLTGAVFDFDNDGRLDVFVASTGYPQTRGWLYRQGEDGIFETVSLPDGIDVWRPYGVGVADFDGDGDLDLVTGHSLARCNPGDPDCLDRERLHYFENVLGERSNWVQLELEGGPGSNRSAIGARVTALAGEVSQIREVDGGHGHFGMQHDLVVHFGLGDACSAEITVRWPDSALSEQSFEVQAGYRYRVVQGQDPSPLLR